MTNEFTGKIICLVLLISFFWLLFLIWLLIRLTSQGPGFYGSIRLGYHRKPIKVLKFRTMHAEVALEVMAAILESREWKEYRKLSKDPRLTSPGRFLRRFSLDELPQLWNVVRGDMALIGPRPIVREENKLYGKYSKLIHSVKPGITGLWQVSGRNQTSYHRRIAINVYYVRHKSWKLDLWILYKTVWAVIGGRGAF